MKKRNPLSTSETMERSTSPRQKPYKAHQPRAGFTGGLADLFFVAFMVSEMDTFIEKPISVLCFSICHLCNAWVNATSGHFGKRW